MRREDGYEGEATGDVPGVKFHSSQQPSFKRAGKTPAL